MARTASLRALAHSARRRLAPSALFFLHLSLCISFVASADAEVQLPELSPADPITISAQAGNRWQVGQYEVWILRGNFVLQQGQAYARAREAVLWIDRDGANERQAGKVIVYLEGDAEVVFDRRPGATRVQGQTWLGRFSSNVAVNVGAATTAGQPDVLPPVYERGMAQRDAEVAATGWRPSVQKTQYAAPGQSPAPLPASGGSRDFPATRPNSPEAGMTPAPQLGGPATATSGGRRIRAYPRSDVPLQVKWSSDPAGRQIGVIDSGVTVMVDGLDYDVGTLDVSTDRLVIWTSGIGSEPDLTGNTVQDQRVPLEFYMEGNIVFRQGERTIHADRMYYDVPNNVGTILNADLLTPVRTYDGLLRLHADVLQQTAKDHYFGKNVFMTSSMMGQPTYRLQSGDLYFEDVRTPVLDSYSGLPLTDPAGQPVVENQRLATASNNFLFLGPVPVFYWPMLATDLNDPTYYIRRVKFKQDNVFGNQILTDWSGYELLGIRNKPVGTDLGVSLDYLSKRGLGHGVSFEYNREGAFTIPGHVGGLADYWGIQDKGNDNLGQGRSDVPPDKDYRFRLFWQHRHQLPYDLQLSAELGWVSDRNFLEEYYKSEWENLKDQSTGIELKRFAENTSWGISADYRLNDFVTSTDWLPRLDHFWLGQSLLGDRLTWYEHTNVAYARLRPTTIPTDSSVGPVTGANGPFNYLPWEVNGGTGERLATRQEIDWPFQLGPVKVVPYLLGEAAHWGEDVNGQSIDRLFGQAGLRASLPVWSVDPTYNSDLFNVHGIAHKTVFDIEFAFADANKDLTDLPLYDALDDDSVEAFRRRFLTNTFGIPSLSPMPFPAGTPWVSKFDERLYALRSGLQNWVASPSTEVADDLATVRLGASQRWQTKRGPINNRHIIDWITLDTDLTLYPEPDRDNYGTVAGLLNYDFAWHVGDRLTLVSDAIFDCFADGQKIVSVGGFLNRPPRGSLYLGYRILQGPIDNQILSVSYSYWMSPKWVSSLGATVDLANQGNIGETFTVTRVGESFLVSFAFNADPSRDSVGIGLLIEPRFLPKSRLGNVAGAQIPPAGAFGLE